MSLYRRGSIWWIELSAHGRRVRESAGTADKKAAQEYHEKRKGEIWRQAKLGEPEPVTWGQAVAAWLKVRPRSMSERYMIAALGISPTAKLPLEKALLSSLLSDSTAGTFNRYVSLVVAIHSTSGASTPSIRRRPNPPGRLRWLTAEEWARLQKALLEEAPLLEQCARFTLETGLRENNVLNLEWAQVDLNRRTAWLHGDQMKGGAPHGVPLTDAALAVLRERRGLHKRYVFPNPDTGLPYYKASNRKWYVALRKSRLKATGVVWHTLRHTWASWHVMNGTRLEELQELGGWKTLQMVRRYAHLATSHLATAASNVKPVSLRYNAPKRGKPDTDSPTKGA
jgi:integrase